MNKYYMACCILTILQMINGAETPKVLAWDAKNYKQNSGPQDYFALYALSQISLEEHYDVLDVGCGNGKTSHYVATQVPQGRVQGIDSSPEMIELANADYGDQNNLKFTLNDITKFDSRPKFNVVIAFNSLPWVEDQKTAYQNIGKALVSGGKLLALVSDSDGTALRAYRGTFNHPRWESYFKDYKPAYYPCTKKEVENYIAAAALKSLAVKKAEIPAKTMSKQDFITVFNGTPGVKDVIPQELYMDYLQDVLAEYLKIVPEDEQGNVVLDPELTLVIAEKP